MLALGAIVLLSGCATPGPFDPSNVSDPLEPVNRRIFWVNDKFDVYLLTPVAKGWDFVAPDRVQTSIGNFFHNLRFPVYFVNDALQGKGRATASDLGRFLVNSTAGIGGLFDPASRLGLSHSDEDFGQTLGHYGIPSGPYLVLPLLGPASVRDAAGGLADGAASVWPFFVPWFVTAGVRAGETINARSRVTADIEEERAQAFDWYVFVRDAYLQRRRSQVRDEQITPKAAAAGLYDVPGPSGAAPPEPDSSPWMEPEPEPDSGMNEVPEATPPPEATPGGAQDPGNADAP